MEEKRKILIADDESDSLQLISTRLRANGYNVVTAADGQEVLTKVKDEHPDLVILDLMMPKLDGYKACRLLKFDVRYRKIPIVILSARAQPEDMQLIKECGADVYFVKPFDPPVFLEKLKELLTGAGSAGV